MILVLEVGLFGVLESEILMVLLVKIIFVGLIGLVNVVDMVIVVVKLINRCFIVFFFS